MEIIKKGYSVNPWRLVNLRGNEIAISEVYECPVNGKTLIDKSISGKTKKECLEKTLLFLELLLDKLPVITKGLMDEKRNKRP